MAPARPDPDLPDVVEVVVGRVGRAHGLRGDVGVELRTDSPDERFAAGVRLRAEPGGELEVAASRMHSGRLLVRFAGVDDRDAAEALRGTLLHTTLDAAARPEDPDEFYDHQLVGLAVVDLDGTALGEVARVVHGAQDLLEVRTPSGRLGLVPFVSALVPEVDLDAGRVVVADRPGLVSPFPDE